MKKTQHIVMTEYERLYIGGDVRLSNKQISKSQFDALEDFVLSNELPNASHYLKLGQTGNRKYLQAQNYIGVIQLKSNLTIEILPKIANTDNELDVREIVIKLLKSLRNSPFKNANKANLKALKMPLMEIFISMFTQEVTNLIKKGIAHDYIAQERNSFFLKGKLLFSQNLKNNLVHKERFYVTYDEYLSDRIENRLIKSTLKYLYKLSNSSRNQQHIREALFAFDGITPIHDLKTALDQITTNRLMKNYKQIIEWCVLFLSGNSFAPHKGDTVAFSLLFDMNQLFESYIGQYLKKSCNAKLALQHKEHHLAHKNGKPCFTLIPDIVINDGEVIADTKWKLLTTEKINNGISQSDIYQMYAYATKYQVKGKECKKIILIYPATENSPAIDTHYEFKNIVESTDNSIPLVIKFFDLAADRFL